MIDALRQALRGVGYEVDAAMERLGVAGQRGLGRNSTVAAQRALGSATDPLASLIRLWLLQQPVERTALERALPGLVEPLCGRGLLEESGGSVRALVDLRPYASDDGVNGWVVSDLTPGLDAPAPPAPGDYVLGISSASTQLTEMVIREPVGSALDLGVGCGVQSLHLARHCARVVATDVNARALELARLTFELNEVEVDLRRGDLYEPVAGEYFDLIVTNPPYVIAPPRTGSDRLTYREGALESDQLVERIVARSAGQLNPGGTLEVLGNWAILGAERWQDRLAGWVPQGCEGWFIERERLDPYEYIEVWLGDAGLVGTPEYQPRYREWLAYFDRLGIDSVGLGWIMVQRTEAAEPGVHIEQYAHPVQHPIGPALAAMRDAVALARLGDEALLNRRWVVAPDVIEQRVSTPGAADPSLIELRQQDGFRRSVRVDTALAGVVGACDGELTLRQLVTAVSGLLETDPDALAAEVLTQVRRLIAEGFLGPDHG